MIKIKNKYYIIGSTGLVKTCFKLLKQKGFEALGIISYDLKLQKWAKQQNVKYIKSIEELNDVADFDYLFSVANPYILPGWLLKKVNKYAINYHDGPLPKYAGTYATSWAILNNEKEHGVTWHIINEKVDLGEILEQVTFGIDNNETTLTLNLKCFQAAIVSFKKLLIALIRGNISRKKQNITERTFYYKNQKPKGAGVINWKMPILDIDRLARSLYFGKYENNFTYLKIILARKIYYPEKISIKRGTYSKYEAGQILDYSDKKIEIAAIEGSVIIEKLYDISGKVVSIIDVIEKNSLRIGSQLNSLSLKHSEDLSNYLKKSSKEMLYWDFDISNIKKINLPWKLGKYNSEILEIPSELLKSKKLKIDVEDYLLALVILYFSKYLQQKELSVNLINNNYSSVLLCNSYPLNFNFKGINSFEKATSYIIEKINLTQKRIPYSTDIAFKNNFDAKSMPISISKEKVLPFNDIEHHAFHITTNKNKITFQCNLEVANLFSLYNFLKNIESFIINTIKRESANIREIPLISSIEREKITKINRADKDYTRSSSIEELFKEQVLKSPDSLGVVSEAVQISYEELNRRSNKIGKYLREEFGVRREVSVGLCIERSEHIVLGILGVLKAGGCYVPMEASYPEERIRYIVEDAECKVILSNEKNVEKISKMVGNKIEVIGIDSEEFRGEIEKYEGEDIKVERGREDLVYIIYTSGTTGKPKGVGVSQGGVVNYLNNVIEYGGWSGNGRIDLSTTLAFDLTVTTSLAALIGGMNVVVYQGRVDDLEKYKNHLKRERIEIAKLVPSYASLIAEGELYLKEIILGGEKLPIELINALKSVGVKRVIDEYGPTEAVVGVYSKEVGERLYIYKNKQIYILNEDINVLPIGAIGEICIGGEGLARGYLNRPGLTAEKFIANPFATEEDIKRGYSRLYKTGDLGRYLSDGNIEYIGRNDEQVKIRGYRIELGEIESVLQSYEGIRQSVVVAKEREGGDKYIAGYYVSEKELDEEKIERYLRDKLPEYMIPSKLKRIEEIPVTVNGKIDKKGLPEVDFIDEVNYVEPRNEIERRMCEIWGEVLGIDKVGIKDDFFKLGGDSIISIQLVNRLRQRFALNITVNDIFEFRDIERIWKEVRQRNKATDIKAESGRLRGNVTLSPIQEWFFKGNYKNIGHWNQSFMLRVPELDIKILEKSIYKLVCYHDSFRLRYRRNAKGMYQQYYSVEKEKIKKVEKLNIKSIAGKEEEKIWLQELDLILTRWQSDFNIEIGPLYKVGYIYGYEDGSARLFFAMHHLIVDTVSWRIISEDLQNLYEGRDLGKKGTSYRQWTEQLTLYKQKNEHEYRYWEKALFDYQSARLLKLQYENSRVEHDIIEITKEDTKKLIRESNKAYNTEINDLLLTSLAIALEEITGENINHIVLEGHGREEIFEKIDIRRCIGWFTVLYPVKLMLSDDLEKTIVDMKENIRQIPNRGLGYGIIKGYDRDKLPKIWFNYLGQFNKKTIEWSVVNENAGQAIGKGNIEDNIINVTGLVIGGKLRLEIISKLGKEKTQKLSKALHKNLLKVIDYTTKKTRCYLTVSDVSNITSAEELDRLQHLSEIVGVYKANSLQQGFIHHAVMQGDSDEAYKMHIIWDYKNNIEIEKLKEAWECAQKKYASLRLRFDWKEDLLQVIEKDAKLDWSYIDLSQKVNKELIVQKIEEDETKKGYSLDEAKLFRIHIIKLEKELYRCIFSNHHAILDGWSGVILKEYVHETYLKKIKGEKIQVIEDRNYEEVQKYIQKNLKKDEEFWHQYISRIEQRTNILALFKNDYGEENYHYIKKYKEKNLIISGDLYNNIKKYNQEKGVTINAMLQYVWHKILSVYGASKQTVVGTVISGREKHIIGIEKGVGLYINTLPLLVEHRSESTEKAIKTIQRDINLITTKSGVNLAKIQKRGERLFETVFAYENYPKSKEKDGSLIIEIKKVIEKLDYPLGILVYEEEGAILVKIKYAGELIENKLVRNIMNMIESFLIQISGRVDHTTELKLLHYTEEEEIKSLNVTNTGYYRGLTVDRLFEEQILRTPDRIAVSYIDQNISYRELNSISNRLARYLKSIVEQNKEQTVVAILVERSIDMVISMIACIKAAMAYLPIDVDYPIERIHHMLRDSKASITITKSKHKANIPNIGKIVFIEEAVLPDNDSNLTLSKLGDLIYLLYTSGSTGLPKGSDLMHAGVSNLLSWYKKQFEIDKKDKIIIFTAFGFDLTQKNILGGLISGSQINLFDDIKFDSKAIVYFLKKNNITFFNCPPSAFYSVIENLDKREKELPTLRMVLLGGEGIKVQLLKDFVFNNKNCKIVNTYGPTECSDLSLTHILDSKEIANNSIIPLGRNVGNVKIYILDEHLNQVPIGVMGEVYIGGIGLARGYWNKPSLTAEKFIANPFYNGNKNEFFSCDSRIYRIGDIAKYLADGNIEYIGRVDHQVKLRGYRIELGEIEAVITSIDNIDQCIVVLREDELNLKKLVAYVLLSKEISNFKVDKSDIINSIRKNCEKNLPEYMRPKQIMIIDYLPLTSNGKIDRSNLPKPEGREGIEEYEEPITKMEKLQAEIWSSILGIKKIGRSDNFFNLGGDSIISLRVVGALKQKGYKLKIHSIFAYKTIKDIAQHIIDEADVNSKYKHFSLISDENKRSFELEENSISDIYPASSLQKGMLIESIFDKYSYHDVVSYLIKIPFDYKKFIGCWERIVTKHSMLRSNFVEDIENGYLLIENKSISLKSKIKIVEGCSTKSIIDKELDKGIDYKMPGVFRLVINTVARNDGFSLVISFHHAIMDGWSLASLILEFVDMYGDSEISINYNSSISYAEFVQEELLNMNKKSLYNLWFKLLEGYKNNINRVVKHIQHSTKLIEKVGAKLSKNNSTKIISYAKTSGFSVDTVFLSAYFYALFRVFGFNDILIGTVVNNRLEVPGGDEQIGLFLNTIPFRYKFKKGGDITSDYLNNQINNIKTELLKIKQYPFMKLKSDFKMIENLIFSFNYVHFHILDRNEKFHIEEFYEKTNIPCVFTVSRKCDKFSFSLDMHDGYFSKIIIQSILNYIQLYLGNLIGKDIFLPIKLHKDDAKINIWNKTEWREGREGSILERFEEEVKKSGDRIALVREGVQISYEELNRRSNKIGKYLREEFGVRREVKVGLCIERSEYTVLSILGVLKAGGCYVPMEASYPEERIRYIVEDAECKVILSNEKNVEKIRKMVENKVEVIEIDSEEFKREIEKYEGEDIKLERGGKDLAYIIYTSGTTGKPKGVGVSQGGVVNRIKWMNKEYPLRKKDKIMQKTSYTFDVSVWELLWAHWYGGSIVIAKEGEQRDVDYIKELSRKEQITIMHFVPTMLNSYLEGVDKGYRDNVKYIFSSGEELKISTVKEIHEKLKRVEVHNLYGPTEATIDVLHYSYIDKNIEKVLIGKPISNTKVYILSKEEELSPIGAIGEICIGGEGLARGYLNRPGLTAEKFIANPFATEEDIKRGYSRLYKTGDLGRYLSDGNIEYIGRNDEQVKIRGYRIELVEIESVLQSYEGVRQSVVVAKEREGGDKYIVGYYVSEKELDEEEIERYLGDKLPEYMIPSKLKRIEEIPVTVNGKIDKKGLPEVDFIDEVNYVEPRNEIERKMCEIWSEVLGIDRVGIKDDFFRLGGHSLLATRLINRINTEYSKKIHVGKIFEYKNIEKFSILLSKLFDNNIKGQTFKFRK